jgi:hypothetical protein
VATSKARRHGGAGVRRGARAAAGAGTWTPAQYAGLIAWYLDTYAAGVRTDVSGNGRTVSQASSGSRPTQVSRAGQLALLYDGSNDFLQGAWGALFPQPLTIYAVMEPTSLAATHVLVDGDDVSNRCIQMTVAGPQWRLSAPTDMTDGVPTAAIHATCAIFDGASSRLYVDDFRDGQHVLTGNVGANGLDGLTVGANFLGGAPYAGYEWELVAIAGAHSAADRARFAAWASARYAGLTVIT